MAVENALGDLIRKLNALGWEFALIGEEWNWIKRDSTGKCIACCGDETWCKDTGPSCVDAAEIAK